MILHSIKASTDETSGEVPGWKRFLDLSCILISLPLWLPIMVLASLAIMVVSPGPILFRQERIGYRGRRFSGKNKTTFDEMIHLDISYLRSKSIWLDLGIMLKTAPALLQQVKELLTPLKDP